MALDDQDLDALILWCESLARTPLGRLRLANLVHDSCEQPPSRALAPTLLATFFDSLIRSWAESDPDPWRVVQVTVRKKPEYRGKGERIEVTEFTCSTIVSRAEFVRTYADLHDDPTIFVSDFTSTADIGQMSVILASAIDRGMALPIGRHIFFLTKTSALDDLRRLEGSSARSVADLVRDGLGLDGWENDYLLELRLPSNSLSEGLCRPTFLDNTSCRAYRSKRSQDSWGVTVDLASRVCEDGLPEAVHHSTVLVAGCTFEDVGFVGDQANPPSDTCLLASACHRWEAASAGKLRTYLNGATP